MSWIDSVVRCPATVIEPFTNATSAPSNSNSSDSSDSASASSPHSHGDGRMTSERWGQYFESEERAAFSLNRHRRGGNKDSEADDLFPFASTTLLQFLLAVEAAVIVCLILYRYHGVLVYSFRRKKRHSSLNIQTGATAPDGTAGSKNFANNTSIAGIMHEASPLRGGSVGKSFADFVGGPSLYGTEDGEVPKKVRIVTKSTDNKMWALYFASLVVVKLIAGGTLVFAANTSEGKTHNKEILRVAWLLQRIVHGISSVWLAIALNIQRIYRVKEHKHAKASATLLRQATLMNRFCFIVFVTFSVGDFVASHVVSDTSDVATGLYWLSIGALFMLSFPAVLSTLWVVFHEAAVQPSKFAKLLLVVGVGMHIVLMLPPSVWNDHWLSSFVDEDPCPLHYLSFYDVLLAAHCVSSLVLFAFVIIEHRRAAFAAHHDYTQYCEDRLYRKLGVEPGSLSGFKPARKGGRRGKKGSGVGSDLNTPAGSTLEEIAKSSRSVIEAARVGTPKGSSIEVRVADEDHILTSALITTRSTEDGTEEGETADNFARLVEEMGDDADEIVAY